MSGVWPWNIFSYQSSKICPTPTWKVEASVILTHSGSTVTFSDQRSADLQARSRLDWENVGIWWFLKHRLKTAKQEPTWAVPDRQTTRSSFHDSKASKYCRPGCQARLATGEPLLSAGNINDHLGKKHTVPSHLLHWNFPPTSFSLVVIISIWDIQFENMFSYWITGWALFLLLWVQLLYVTH